MSIGDYAAKFDELCKYCSFYTNNESSKCTKFQSELRPEIRQA